MRKKLLSLFVILFIVFFLSACNGESNGGYETIVTWQDAYFDILQEYALQLTETDEWGNAFNNFLIYDIDKDGVPEIIILSADNRWIWTPVSAYTFRDDLVVRLNLSVEFMRAVASLHGFGAVNNEEGIEVVSLSHNRIHFHRFMVYGDGIVMTRYGKIHAFGGDWTDLRFYTGNNHTDYHVATEEELSKLFATGSFVHGHMFDNNDYSFMVLQHPLIDEMIQRVIDAFNH